MHIGLAVSVLMHVAILGWAIFTIQTQRQLVLPETEPIAVDLVSPSEVTKVTKGVKTAKQTEAEAKETPKPEISKKEAPKPTPPAVQPKSEPPPPKEEAKPEPPKPEPKAEPEPPKEVAKPEPPKPEPPKPPEKDPIAEQLATEKPDPALEQAKLDEQKREEERKKEEQKKVEEQKRAEELKKQEEARKQAELKKKLDEEKKKKQAELKKKLDEEKKRKEAEAKKKSFDAEDIQALLNKVPDKGAPTYAKPTEEPTKNKGPTLGTKDGKDQTLSISESRRLVAMLTEKIRTCYRPPVGATAGLEGLKVSLSFDLKRDGSVVPGSIRVRGVGGASALPVAVEAAERAVIGCQPYDMLPPDKYDFWKGVDLIFNPKDLFGG